MEGERRPLWRNHLRQGIRASARSRDQLAGSGRASKRRAPRFCRPTEQAPLAPPRARGHLAVARLPSRRARRVAHVERPSFQIADCPPEDVARLHRELGVSGALAQVLVRRGFGEPADARAFLAAEGGHPPAPPLPPGPPRPPLLSPLPPVPPLPPLLPQPGSPPAPPAPPFRWLPPPGLPLCPRFEPTGHHRSVLVETSW